MSPGVACRSHACSVTCLSRLTRVLFSDMSMTMWLYFPSWKALWRHEAAANTPWCESVLRREFPPCLGIVTHTGSTAWTRYLWAAVATRSQEGRHVGEWRVGPTCFGADGVIDGALRAGHTSAGCALRRRLPVDQTCC